MQRLVPRARTALIDAYLTPVLDTFLDSVSEKCESLFVMTSSGGLTARRAFHPKDSLLSGPAGGVVGALAAGRAAGFEKLIAFDMGGTSTDVCLLSERGAQLVYEHGVGDVRLLAPAVAVESVAAGGGSICSLDRAGRLRVGPESAGARPGPACYGAGGPLTITDVNLLLGRIDPESFPLPLDRAAAERAAEKLLAELEYVPADPHPSPLTPSLRPDEVGNRPKGGPGRDADSLLHGLLDLANESMAAAIRKISVARGIDPSLYALVAFGGAGGQHACAVAEKLGIDVVVIPPDQSLLSAFGLSQATLTRLAERQVLAPLDSFDVESLSRSWQVKRKPCSLRMEPTQQKLKLPAASPACVCSARKPRSTSTLKASSLPKRSARTLKPSMATCPTGREPSRSRVCASSARRETPRARRVSGKAAEGIWKAR